MNDQQSPEMKHDIRERILAVFTEELPHTVRILNPERVTEEVELGTKETPDDNELPTQAVYSRYETAMDGLVEDGILQTGDWMGITAYGLTVEFQQKFSTQVVCYLENKATSFRTRFDRARDPEHAAEEHRPPSWLLDQANFFEGAAKRLKDID
jgi:hypothetical protein